MSLKNNFLIKLSLTNCTLTFRIDTIFEAYCAYSKVILIHRYYRIVYTSIVMETLKNKLCLMSHARIYYTIYYKNNIKLYGRKYVHNYTYKSFPNKIKYYIEGLVFIGLY